MKLDQIRRRIHPTSDVTRGPCKPYFHMDYSIYLIWTHRFWLRIVPFTKFGHTDFDYRYLKWRSRRLWPVNRGCLLLLGNWSYLRICRRSVLPCTRFCNFCLDYGCVLHIVNFTILYRAMPEGDNPSFWDEFSKFTFFWTVQSIFVF
jgi:hypothetical protein